MQYIYLSQNNALFFQHEVFKVCRDCFSVCFHSPSHPLLILLSTKHQPAFFLDIHCEKSRKMEPLVSVSLELLYLYFLTMINSIAMGMQASLHALLRLLPAYLMRLFERPPAQPFRFLDLPPELRNMVYGHLSDRFWITHRRVIRRQRRAVLADAFLYLNKQVYGEAMHVLGLRMKGVHRIKICAVPSQDLHSTESFLRVPSPFNASMQKRWPILLYTHTIHLDISWLHVDWLYPSRQGPREILNVRLLKGESIQMACVSWLVKMPNLRTIKIGFFGGLGHSRLYFPLYPSKHRVPGLLRSLKVLRRERPEVVIQMPEVCLISTGELARQQEDMPWWLEVHERLEYMTEGPEDATALVEGLVTMDGGFML